MDAKDEAYLEWLERKHFDGGVPVSREELWPAAAHMPIPMHTGPFFWGYFMPAYANTRRRRKPVNGLAKSWRQVMGLFTALLLTVLVLSGGCIALIWFINGGIRGGW